MKTLLLTAAIGCAWGAASGAPPDIAQIMSRVAINQAKSQDLRKSYVYNQKQLLRMVRGSGKIAREERREYVITPNGSGHCYGRISLPFSSSSRLSRKQRSFAALRTPVGKPAVTAVGRWFVGQDPTNRRRWQQRHARQRRVACLTDVNGPRARVSKCSDSEPHNRGPVATRAAS